MMTARGSLYSSANAQTFSVCTSTPATPSTRTSAASAATRAALVSLIKMLYPGVSRMLILALFPLRHGDGSGDRDLASDLFVVKIRDRVAFIDAEEAVGSSGGEEQPGGERRLAGIAVAHHTDVPNVLAFVDFHVVAPLNKTEW